MTHQQNQIVFIDDSFAYLPRWMRPRQSREVIPACEDLEESNVPQGEQTEFEFIDDKLSYLHEKKSYYLLKATKKRASSRSYEDGPSKKRCLQSAGTFRPAKLAPSPTVSMDHAAFVTFPNRSSMSPQTPFDSVSSPIVIEDESSSSSYESASTDSYEPCAMDDYVDQLFDESSAEDSCYTQTLDSVECS